MQFFNHYFWTIYNIFLFKLKKIKFGKGLRVYNKVYIRAHKNAKIEIGDNFRLISGGGYNPICRNTRGYIRVDENAHLQIGNNVGMSSTTLWAKEEIIIGNNVKIGGDCIIMDNDAHSLDYKIRNGGKRDEQGNYLDSLNAKKAPIIIEDDVLLGTRCIVLKGVTIGARSVIGAGSVVSKSIPSDCIAAGNPCKVIKQL